MYGITWVYCDTKNLIDSRMIIGQRIPIVTPTFEMNTICGMTSRAANIAYFISIRLGNKVGNHNRVGVTALNVSSEYNS